MTEPQQAAADPEVGRDLANGDWHRVHPLTPAIRSWQIVVVVILFGGQNVGTDVVQGGDLPDLGEAHVAGRWLAGGGALVVAGIAIAIGIAWLSWRMTRFRVSEDSLEINSGVLFRQERRARLDRVQAIDVVQPLLARVFGLARLTVEVAGGSGSGVTLSYLTETQAASLRAHLLARAAGVSYDTREAPEAPEHPTLEVPVPRLIGSLALSGTTLALVVFVLGFAVASAVTGQVEIGFGAVPMLLGVAGVLWARFNGGFGFRLATSPDGLRLRHGLLEHRAQTVPPGRVQAVKITQPLLWRTADWWRIEVNVAGYGGSDSENSTDSVLLPVGDRQEAVGVLALVLPELGVEPGEHPGAVVDAGLRGEGPGGGWLPVPDRARWVDPVAWRRTAVRVTGEALLIRRGRLVRRLEVVPHARSQSWGLRQGPLQRRLGVATFSLHSTPGPVSPQVPHLDQADAARLIEQQAVRARRARAAAGPERWMERLSDPAAASSEFPSEPGTGSPAAGESGGSSPSGSAGSSPA